jgi:outer membrane protein assembly factor BamE (lipoprotein component of BamABCDE complex)
LNRTARESGVVATLPSIVPGQTTKEEVLLALGEPDAFYGNQFFYSWRKFKFLLILPPAGYFPAGATAHKKSTLVITFDERGVVSEQKIEGDWEWR